MVGAGCGPDPPTPTGGVGRGFRSAPARPGYRLLRSHGSQLCCSFQELRAPFNPAADVRVSRGDITASQAFHEFSREIAAHTDGTPRSGSSQINFEEFLVCLALCGHIKYAEVKKEDGTPAMSLAQKVEGIFDNYLGTKDELKVIQPIVAPPPPRFNPATASKPGKPPPPATFMNAWQKMDLSHLWGFPVRYADVLTVYTAQVRVRACVHACGAGQKKP